MISFEDITKLFSVDLKNKMCIEIEFNVSGFENYQYCWMGKMPDKTDKEKEIYWYGLESNGSKAYDYDNFADFSSTPVFDGKSLAEVWDDIELLSIDSIDPEERLQFYI